MVFVIILVTCLITFLVLIISSITYLITLIVDEPDDTYSDSLGINVQDFSQTPVESPNDLPINNNARHTHDLNLEREHSEVTGCPNVCQIGLSSVHHQSEESDSISSANPEDILSAQLNSRIIDAGRDQLLNQDNSAASSSGSQASLSDASKPEDSIGLSSWRASASAQKNLIASQMGAAASKPVFDDFDSKEMQLGGTGLHWCKTRKSLDKLMKLSLPMEIVNKRHETALHVAVRRHKLSVLIGLLNYGANLECRNEHGETPLIVACKVNDIFACQLLLVYDADFDAKDNLGYSARHYIASICDRHKVDQQLPSAAHLILAMLNEIGAARCLDANATTTTTKTTLTSIKTSSAINQQAATIRPTRRCTDGCSATGNYNGNSYNRWQNCQAESLYKKHMFSDIVQSKQNQSKQEKKSRLLSIDGGGLRGVIVCQVMIELEKYLARPVISYFDWIGGTSVGAFLACAMCNGTKLRDLRGVCFDVKDEVFSGSKPYNSKFIERVLKRTYGTTLRMSDIKEKKLAITTVIADRDPCQLRFFRNFKSSASLLDQYGYPADLFNNISSNLSTNNRRAARKSLSDLPNTCQLASKVLTTASKQLESSILREGELRPPVATMSAETPAHSATPRATTPVTETTTPITTTKMTATTDPVELASKTTTATKITAPSTSSTDNDKDETQTPEHVLDENESDPLVWQAVRASAAAPFFFKPYGPYLDGGIISNNPTLDMLCEFYSFQRVRKFLRQKLVASGKSVKELERSTDLSSDQFSKLDLVVSLGTGRGKVIGRQPMVDFGQVASGFATVFSPRELVRSIRAARELFKKLMHQSCHTEDYILDRAQAWCSSLDVAYFRLNPPLATIFSIDDKRDEQLINAMWQTKLFMKAMSQQIRELAQILDGQQIK